MSCCCCCKEPKLTRYRTCLVNNNLDQISDWKFIPEAGPVKWKKDELKVTELTEVRKYLVHDTVTDAIGIAHTDMPNWIGKRDTIEMTISFQEGKYRDYTEE